MSRRFAAGCGAQADWRDAVDEALQRLGPLPAGANLGFLYAGDQFAADYPALVQRVIDATGIANWSGTVGLGVAATGGELFDRPAVSLLVGAFPPEAFRLFGPLTQELGDFARREEPWLSRQAGTVAVLQADPQTPDLPALLADFGQATNGFALGGLTATRGSAPGGDPGLSGVLFSGSVALVSGLTQGCTPLGEARRITAAERNVVMEIDGQPALNVLAEIVQEHFDGKLQEAWRSLHPAFPVLGRDTNDYLVRNFVGVDPERGWLAVGDLVEPGQALLFCRRDQAAARQDLARMLADVRRRAERPPQAGLYFSCVARGPNLFGEEGAELAQVSEALGDLPLAGFYAAGEISGDRLYGYTGVLALFL